MDTVIINDTLRAVHSANLNSFQEYIQNPESVITITAVLISGLALYISYFWNRKTYRLNERHNILSVKPILSIYSEKNSEEKYILYLC